MTVLKAKQFIARVQTDRTLRDQINEASSAQEIVTILATEDLSFSEQDFTEAHSFCLANSKSKIAEEELRQLEVWWHFLMHQSS